MRICLIGPSYPFRGGLAHYTTLLFRHLRVRHQVSFYAFKRQYPRWFFPGRTDKDISEAPLQEEEAYPILDSIDPLTWLDIYRRIKRNLPDLVIIPWWTSFWTPQFWTITTLVKRFSSAKVLFICHNVVDHESHLLSRVCTRAVLRRGDYFFVHSQSDEHRLRELIPWATITRTFHPLYDFFRSGGLAPSDARARLDLQGETVLFFGFIRPYKGVEDLLRALPLILKQRRITLLVVGEFWQGKEAFNEQIRELNLEQAVRVVDRYVPNEEVELYFSAADLVVLPYVSGTGSGIVQIAYGLERPVVATRVGSLPEVVEDGKTGFLVDPGDPKALAEAVLRYFLEGKKHEFVENIRCTRDKFSWEHLVNTIATLTVAPKAEVRDMPPDSMPAPSASPSAKTSFRALR
jgi:glycosyltransferase involved in cell wall biosynthesis